MFAQSIRLRLCAALIFLALYATISYAQAPAAIQFFMPDGTMPTRELRFTLARDDGRIEILYTDSKGKFQMTREMIGDPGTARNPSRDVEYTVTIESDERTYGTTRVSFRLVPNMPVYATVSLRLYTGKGSSPAGVLNVASSDAGVAPQARAAYEQAMKFVKDGDVEEAIGALKRAVEIDHSYLRALNDLGVLYLKLNRLSEAEEALSQAVKINKRFYFARLNLGIVLNRQGKYKEASEVLGALRKEEPKLAGVRLPYAEALAGAGKTAEAKQLLRDVLSEATLDQAVQAEAHFRLGAIFNREENFAEAATELEKSAQLDPNSLAAHLQLGGALIQLKKFAEAERELLRAYEIGGARGAGAAQLLLGQLYYLQEKYAPALRAFEQYLKDVPDAPNAAPIKSTVEKIKAALEKR